MGQNVKMKKLTCHLKTQFALVRNKHSNFSRGKKPTLKMRARRPTPWTIQRAPLKVRSGVKNRKLRYKGITVDYARETRRIRCSPHGDLFWRIYYHGSKQATSNRSKTPKTQKETINTSSGSPACRKTVMIQEQQQASSMLALDGSARSLHSQARVRNNGTSSGSEVFFGQPAQ